MGCDIHCFREIKVKGKWYLDHQPRILRDYQLFAKMANVRNEEPDDKDYIIPISNPKGLPKDISEITLLYTKSWQDDGHSYSWLNAEEIAELERFCMNELDMNGFDFHSQIGYIGGEYYADFLKKPTDRKFIEDIRFVFWFDN